MFFKGGKVDVDNIDTILENMGIKLTEAELKELSEALPVDGEHCRTAVSLYCVFTKLYRISKVAFPPSKRHWRNIKKKSYYFIKTQSHQFHLKVDKVS